MVGPYVNAKISDCLRIAEIKGTNDTLKVNGQLCCCQFMSNSGHLLFTGSFLCFSDFSQIIPVLSHINYVHSACLEIPVKCSQRQLCSCILLLRFHGWAVMLLRLALVGNRQYMLFCEGGPLRILGTTCDGCCGCCHWLCQLCVVVVSCCSGSLVGQLLYWLG